MFQNFSSEQAARLAMVVGFVLQLLKVNIGQEELVNFFSASFVVAGFVYGWYKRYQQGDLKLSGVRK